MAELIKKDEAKKEMWWLFNNYVNNASNFEPEETEAVNRSFGRLQNVIDDMPTTTESEIRAKAIDEFAEKLKAELLDAKSVLSERREMHERESEIAKMCSYNIGSLNAVHKMVDEIAEQLKGE